MLFVTKPMSIDVAGAADEARRVTTHALERAGEMAANTSRKVRAGFEGASGRERAADGPLDQSAVSRRTTSMTRSNGTLSCSRRRFLRIRLSRSSS